MNDLFNPGSAALAPQPSRLPLRVRRSAVACRTCRRRKIRCDVTSLYDLGTERDPFHIAQAALLLADHFDYLDPLANTTWITIAVENIRRASTHRSQMLEIYEIRKYRLSDLKRLWWCCLLRDRITSLASRRPSVLTLDQFDPRGADELSIPEVWDDDCEAFDSSMRTVLYQALMGQCRLTTFLTPHTLSTNPSLGGIGPNVCVEKEKAAAMDVIRGLCSWNNEYKELLANRETRTNLAVAANLHLTSIYYIGAHFILLNRLVILYLFRCRCSYDIDEAAGYEQYLGRLMLLVSQINSEVEWFATNKVLYFLPISIRCIVLLPHAFNVLWADRYGLEGDLADANDILVHYAKLDEDYSIRFGLSKLSHTVPGMMNLLMANHDASLIASVKCQDMDSLTPAQCLCFSRIGVHLSVVLDYGFSTGAAHQITPDIIRPLYRRIFSRNPEIHNCSEASGFPYPCSASFGGSSAKSHTAGASPSGTQSSGATPSFSGEPYHSISPPVSLLTPSTELTGSSWQKESQKSGNTSLERFNPATNVSQQSMQE
ncbi:hypothetical protein BDV19DRAFT_392052 [Aspergillus venezuelensis]